jgi:hypothetical protein
MLFTLEYLKRPDYIGDVSASKECSFHDEFFAAYAFVD